MKVSCISITNSVIRHAMDSLCFINQIWIHNHLWQLMTRFIKDYSGYQQSECLNRHLYLSLHTIEHHWKCYRHYLNKLYDHSDSFFPMWLMLILMLIFSIQSCQKILYPCPDQLNTWCWFIRLTEWHWTNCIASVLLHDCIFLPQSLSHFITWKLKSKLNAL